MSDNQLFTTKGVVIMTDDPDELKRLKAEAKAAGLTYTVSQL